MTLKHYGWLVSPYSAKTRSYLRYKGIAFSDEHPTIPALYGRIQKAVGRMIMPTVEQPDGTWLQDSSDIIDALETQHPTPAVEPDGPTQALASSLLELYGDEWLPMMALHYRWNTPANRAFALAEFAREGLPWLPGFIGRRAVQPVAKRMAGYLPALGVTADTIPGVERAAEKLISQLDVHLADHAYLLGDRPCVGDFALFGPLWAHLFRDPGSTALFDEATHVRSWMRRLLTARPADGDFISDDEVPASLDPVFATVFQETITWITRLVTAIDSWCSAHPDAERVPRALGHDAFSVGGASGTRKLITFVQYKAQRAILPYQALTTVAREPVDAWIARVAGEEAKLPTIAHPFERREFRTVLRT
ncbi:MAG: glutathione S-transferase family protein [Polyangiaceae bacterium]